MACVSASSPDDIMTERGQSLRNMGSRMARTGKLRVVLIPSFFLARESMKTALKVTSLPVPAVVGRAMTGVGLLTLVGKPLYSMAGFGL